MNKIKIFLIFNFFLMNFLFQQKIFSTENSLDNVGIENKLDRKFDIDSSKKIDQTNIKVKTNNSNFLYDISSRAQDIIKKSSSIGMQIFFVVILGLLMSLTPCIYPVIPITVGILQVQGSKSVLYNFLLSLSYAVGIATTFAVLGLAAALGGLFFGQILTQPLFIIFISIFLIYLALAMFGFYEVYIPKFLTSSTSIQKKGSLLSTFMFGAVSGTIASPCLSPGLALLLTIVASLGNKLLGFILLFSFGIGLSIPLILIGTFSSSINLLPRAGVWMEEVKKIFGFLLFGMTFYYLSNIIPLNIILCVVSIFIFSAGIYYFISLHSYDSKYVKIFKKSLGLILIFSSILIAINAYQKTFYDHEQENSLWSKNYNDAANQAIKENKNLIVDIGATYCTICKAIDKRVFNNLELKDLFKNFVLVKVDATNSNQEPYFSLKQKYDKEIIGVPTILIINPRNNSLLKYWRSELYEMPIEEIKEQLKKII